MGEHYTKQAYEEIYKHSSWQAEAKNYEENLAVTLFHSSYTKNAVKTALSKISRILTTYYGENGKELKMGDEEVVKTSAPIMDVAQNKFGIQNGDIPINKTLVEALMQSRKDNSGAGQVRKVMAGDERGNGTQYNREQAEQRNEEILNEVINGDGNLREQMTLLYNGMFINGGKTAKEIHDGVSFKGVLQRMKEADQNKKQQLGIDYELLNGLEQFQKGEDVFDTYSLARDLEKREEERQGKGNRLTRWWRGMKRALDATLFNRFRRIENTEKRGLGMEHYENLKIAPSKRERAFAVMQNEEGQKQIAWKEGAAYYHPAKERTAEGMLQTAGSSGTTLRMLGAYRLMGASQKELLEFRLALIAWMVSSHDHSLYEILKGSHNAGVKGTEDLQEAATMYTNIDPLDTELLRENVAKEHEFPHEIVYKKMLNELYNARAAKEGVNISAEEMAVQSEPLLKEIREREAELRQYQDTLQSLGDWESPGVALAAEPILEEMLQKSEELKKPYERMIFYERFALYQGDHFSKIRGVDATKMKAQDLAINIYTTSAYRAMNGGMSFSSRIARSRLRETRGYKNAQRREYKDDKLLERIADLVQISARMAQDALEEQSSSNQRKQLSAGMKSHDGWLFRGEKGNGSKYKEQGREFVTDTLGSFSTDLVRAMDFYRKKAEEAGPDNAVLIAYQINNDNVVDISDISNYEYEKEVLIPKGTRFKVEKPYMKNVPSADIWKGNMESYQSDPNAKKQEIKKEISDYKKFLSDKSDQKGIDEKEAEIADYIQHVNIVQVKAVWGPGQKRRNERLEDRESRTKLRESLKKAAEKLKEEVRQHNNK